MFGTLIGRESGQSQRVSTDGLVHRLRRRHLLEGHEGCVNSVYFTPDGHHLLTGSDDRKIMIWDWEKGTVATKWDSGHTDNVFQARQIGFGSKTVVSCAADGQVRVHLLKNSGPVSTDRIGKHNLRAHKLALDPAQLQCFYSSGEDAFVRHYDIREKRCGSQKLLRVHSCVQERRNQVVRLYGVHVNPTRPTQFAVGGNEEYVQIYDARMIRQQRQTLRENPLMIPLEKYCPANLAPTSMHALHHVTSCMFSSRGELLVTYNNDDVYLFHPWLKQVLAVQSQEDSSKRRRGRSGSGHDASPSKKSCKSSSPTKHLNTSNKLPCPHTNSQTERTENHSSQTAAPSCNETSLAPQGASASFPAPEEAIDADAEATTHDRQRTAAVADGGRQDDLQQGEAEIDGNEFAEDGIQQQLDDANNAAEELLRGLFDELVTNNDAAVVEMSRSRQGASAAENEQACEPQATGRASPTYEPGAEQEEREQDVASDWEREENDGEEEEEEEEEDDEDEEDDDDDSPPGEEWDDMDPDDEPWLNVLPGGARQFRQLHRQLHRPDPMPPHCLQGYIPEEPSTRWLAPTGDAVVQRFRGHKNVETVKGVTFFGDDDEYIASGSDCGNLFVWSKRDGLLRSMQPGDTRILNCVAPHPTDPFTLATSGIDDDVKVWGLKPTEEEEEPESLSDLEQTLRVNAHRNTASSFRSRLFVPFLLGARFDSMDF